MKKTLVTLALLTLLSSCARTQSGVSSALIFTSWDDTISASVNNSVEIKKEGKACAMNVLGLVTVGDSSVETAKRSVAITKVAFADTTYLNVLGLFQQGCTVVKGE